MPHPAGEVTVPFCVGEFVACKLKKYEEEEPQIGQVTSLLEGGKIIIEWWVGTYSTIWVTWKIRGITQTEELSAQGVLKNNIHLTKTNRLTNIDVKELKLLYTTTTFV